MSKNFVARDLTHIMPYFWALPKYSKATSQSLNNTHYIDSINGCVAQM
jgi:hypothetical protein